MTKSVINFPFYYFNENSVKLLFFRYRPLYPELQHHFDTENIFDKNYMKVNMTSLLERSDAQTYVNNNIISFDSFTSTWHIKIDKI